MTATDVRTAAAPMAFTGREFARGAFGAWVIFMVLLFAALVISGFADRPDSPFSLIFVLLLYGIPIGAIVSAVVTLVCSPVAWFIGRALRRQQQLPMHIAAYLLLGATIGVLVIAGSVQINQGDVPDTFSTGSPWIVAAICAVSVAGGWGYTVRRAVRERDRRRARMRPQ